MIAKDGCRKSHLSDLLQDLPENGSDQAHLSHLHIPSITAGNDLSTQFESWFNIAKHIFKVSLFSSFFERVAKLSNHSFIVFAILR